MPRALHFKELGYAPVTLCTLLTSRHYLTDRLLNIRKHLLVEFYILPDVECLFWLSSCSYWILMYSFKHSKSSDSIPHIRFGNSSMWHEAKYKDNIEELELSSSIQASKTVKRVIKSNASNLNESSSHNREPPANIFSTIPLHSSTLPPWLVRRVLSLICRYQAHIMYDACSSVIKVNFKLSFYLSVDG